MSVGVELVIGRQLEELQSLGNWEIYLWGRRRDFIKIIITGTSKADCEVLIIAYTLSVKKLVVSVKKILLQVNIFAYLKPQYIRYYG